MEQAEPFSDPSEASARVPRLSADGVSCHFGEVRALSNVSLSIPEGEIHSLLGPNGAGKTTLVRVLAGLIHPTTGAVSIDGIPPGSGSHWAASAIGLIPSGDRTFYLRLSGEENLLFFARMHGMRKSEARARARELLDRVDLLAAARQPVGLYSHGMVKRLSVARAFLADPPVLLVDEATHDLDPDGARRVRTLVAEAAASGAAVLWATQRLDEIRGFADRVTVIAGGTVRFEGSVSQLVAIEDSTRYVLRLRNGRRSAAAARKALERAVAAYGSIAPERDGDQEHFLLTMSGPGVLGDALSAIGAARFSVLSCREQRSGVEEAFMRLTRDEL